VEALAPVRLPCGCLSRGERLGLDRRDEAYAARSIASDSARSEGHTWWAAVLGSMAVFEGSKAKVRLCTVIKQEFDRAIELNPRDDVTDSILGSFYMILGNASWLERRLESIFLGALPEGDMSNQSVRSNRLSRWRPGSSDTTSNWVFSTRNRIVTKRRSSNSSMCSRSLWSL